MNSRLMARVRVGVGALVLTVAPVAFLASPASARGGTGISATSAATKSFANCSAQFVRSASDIINETNRVCTGGNGFSSLDVWLQFRPLTNPTGGVVPDPACEGSTVVPVFTYTNDPTQNPYIAGTYTSGYFLSNVTYNV